MKPMVNCSEPLAVSDSWAALSIVSDPRFCKSKSSDACCVELNGRSMAYVKFPDVGSNPKLTLFVWELALFRSALRSVVRSLRSLKVGVTVWPDRRVEAFVYRPLNQPG